MEQYMSFVWIIGIGAVMYFVMIRPQRKQQKEKTAMMSNLKKGDKVVTVGGIYGIVRGIKDDRVTLEIASEIYVQFTKTAIGTVMRKDDKTVKKEEPEALPEADDFIDAEEVDYEIEQDQDNEDNA